MATNKTTKGSATKTATPAPEPAKPEPVKTAPAKEAKATKETKTTKEAPVAKNAPAKSKEVESTEPEAKALTKTQVLKELAAKCELDLKQVSGVFDALEELIRKELLKGAGEFSIPNLIKLKLVRKPATQGGMKKHPITKEMIMTQPKPASVKVKPVVLKGLKNLDG
jgi:nucleoid DNA-binding protein